MTPSKGSGRGVRLLFFLRRCIVFFAVLSLIVTVCMLLFLNLMQKNMGIELEEDGINQAAVITFVGIVLITVVCVVIDTIRRKIMIGRPVRRIISAAEKIMKGDFSVRVKPVTSPDDQNGFNIIIEYFNRMAEELSGLETLRTDFIANVSHELKTPLAVVLNYGTMLQQPGLTEEKRIEYAKSITDTSRRLSDLITNILRLNKLENQQIYPENKIYNLGEQLCECLLDFENVWEQKKIEIFTDIEEEVYVETDAELMSLVWRNLFSNALKFTEPGGSVYVNLRAEGGFAYAEVRDTGCGISRETGKHIFEKFYQGDKSHSTQGNGLGLALVKRVADIVGGDISVSSEINKGSTFTVKIRRKENEAV